MAFSVVIPIFRQSRFTKVYIEKRGNETPEGYRISLSLTENSLIWYNKSGSKGSKRYYICVNVYLIHFRSPRIKTQIKFVFTKRQTHFGRKKERETRDSPSWLLNFGITFTTEVYPDALARIKQKCCKVHGYSETFWNLFSKTPINFYR